MPRGSLVFSVVNLVFVLVVLSISLCKCRFLDLYLVFHRFTSFGKSVGNVFLFLVCSLSYLLHCTRSHRLCFVFSRSPFRTVCRCYSICLCVLATCVNMLSSKNTKRGFGSCPQCGRSYFTRRKPPNCEECGYDLGGTNQPAPKKPKRNCPSAVLFVGSSHFSCKTSTKDDRCFFIKEGESVFCSQK